jgi:methylenetetrahydrofolate reductase (NADH)
LPISPCAEHPRRLTVAPRPCRMRSVREPVAVRIPELYAQPEPTVSLELFPPKTDAAEGALFADTLPALKRLRPAFLSVTYGAGGSTRTRTLRITQRIRAEFGLEAMAHLTCVGATAEMLGGVLDEARALGIENLLALRGDPPKGETQFQPAPGGFRNAWELVRFIRGQGCFSVGVAGYPEGHLECPDKRLDWDRTAAKVEHGAEFILTQLFYEADNFLEFRDYLRHRRGVRVPIVPGVLPFLSGEQIRRFTALCGAKLPDGLRRRLDALGGDDEAVRQLGVEVCTGLCRRLLDEGVPGLHLYCLNRAASCTEILRNLGLAAPACPPEACMS